MSITLENLRHAAKEILALAVLELFPGTLLVGGSVDEIGFSYDFVFSEKIIPLFGERELMHLEDQMRRVMVENRPIKELDMMRENAILPARAISSVG